MKQSMLLFAILLMVNQLSNAQSVTLATSTANPTKGTVVYNNGTNQLQYWNGSAWIPITNAASGTGWALSGTHLTTNNSGYVGIGVTTPEAPLVVKAEGIGISQQSYDGNAKIGFYTESYGGGIATVQTHSNHDLTFAAANGSTSMIIQKGTGNVGIGYGTTNPVNKFQIGSVGSTGFSGYNFALGDGTRAMGIYQSSETLIASSTAIVLRPSYNPGSGYSGYVGINVSNPTNKLQIGAVTSGTIGNDLAIGNGTSTMTIYQTNASTKLSSTTDIVLKPKNNGAGYVGINIDNPANKLQIGSVGSTNYNGNDFVIGNGTSVFAINQAAFVTQIVPTTDIALLPRGNNQGRVGINTSTPRAPLEVASNASYYNGYDYDYFNNGGSVNGIDRCTACTAYISIYASNAVYATEFDAYSDARIKDIIGVSNSAIDLETIKSLQITDYTMKDKIKNGNKPYKKVIAQQVEKYYPQAVNQGTEVVPDIYSLAEKVVFNEINKTLTCLLSKNYDIKIGEKIEFIHAEKGKLKAEVIEVSGNSFTVKDWQYPTDKIFVYGREVNDFRSVDYEAISMLGISAIQQLAKENEELKNKMKSYENRLDALEALLIKSQPGK